MVGHGTNIMDLKHMVYLLRLYDNVHKRLCGTFATEETEDAEVLVESDTKNMDLKYMVYI